MTLKEYLQDYASDETKKIGYDLIAKEVEMIDSNVIKEKVEENLVKIEAGSRDFRF